MKKYNPTLSSIQSLMRSSSNAAVCPFPGSHPLRLLWVAGTKSYNGKFTSNAAKAYERASNALVRAGGRHGFFYLYDKRQVALFGRSPGDVMSNMGRHIDRYLYTTSGYAPLTSLRRAQVGRYWLYSNEEIPPLLAAIRARRIETNIPHVRNA